MALPRITIVTPALNCSATIEATLRSVAEQRYPDLEHLVIDGGSSDATLEILERAAGVSWTSEPDKGLSDAFNKGARRASGDVVGWLNADDLLMPCALSRVGEAFALRPDALWLTGRCIVVDGAGSEIRKPVTAYKNLLLRRYSIATHLLNNYVSAPATFVRRAALRKVGLLELDQRYAMDYDLWLRLARLQPPIVLDGDPLSAFRMIEGTISMDNFQAQLDEAHAIARARGEGHPVALAGSALAHRAIGVVYRSLAALRGRA